MVNPGCARPNSRSCIRETSGWLARALLISSTFFAAVASPEAAVGSDSTGLSSGSGLDPEESLSGPDIRIILEEERTLYEFRQNGQLRMVRVEPRVGKPYYLVPRDPTKGFGDLMRADMLLPSWVLVRF